MAWQKSFILPTLYPNLDKKKFRQYILCRPSLNPLLKKFGQGSVKVCSNKQKVVPQVDALKIRDGL